MDNTMRTGNWADWADANGTRGQGTSRVPPQPVYGRAPVTGVEVTEGFTPRYTQGPAPANTAPNFTGAPAANSSMATGLRAGLITVGGAARTAARGAATFALPFTAKDVFDTPTEQYEKRFGFGPNTNDGVTGLLRDVGVRALGAASDLGNNMTFGAAGRLFQDRAAAPAQPAAPTATTSPANPTDSRLAGGTQGAPLDSGTEVQGAPGVRKFFDARNGVSYSNVPGEPVPTGRVSVLPFSEGLERQARANDIYHSIGVPPGGPSQPTAPVSSYDADTAARNATVRSNLTPVPTRNEVTLRGQDLERRGQDIQARGQDIQAATARDQTAALREGHHLTYDASVYGTEMGGRNARARLAYEQGKDARDFGLRKAEFGETQNKNAFDQQREGEQQFQKNLESRFRTKDEKGNDVADTAKVAAFRTAANKTIPSLVTALESAGTPEAKAKAADIRKRGVAALEPGDLDKMQQLFDTRERMRAARGYGPNQGTFADSDNLLDYQQLPGAAGVERRVFGGNRVVTPAGSVSANDLAYTDGPANAFLPDFFKIRDRNLTRGLRTE